MLHAQSEVYLEHLVRCRQFLGGVHHLVLSQPPCCSYCLHHVATHSVKHKGISTMMYQLRPAETDSMTAQARKRCDVRCQATKAVLPAKTQDYVACAMMYHHLELLLQPLSPALGLLQGFAGSLSIAHKQIIHCSCRLKSHCRTEPLFPTEGRMKCTYQAAKCNKLGLLTCC